MMMVTRSRKGITSSVAWLVNGGASTGTAGAVVTGTRATVEPVHGAGELDDGVPVGGRDTHGPSSARTRIYAAGHGVRGARGFEPARRPRWRARRSTASQSGRLSSTAPPVDHDCGSVRSPRATPARRMPVVTLTLLAPSSSTVSVELCDRGRDRDSGTDYTTASGTATFAAGRSAPRQSRSRLSATRPWNPTKRGSWKISGAGERDHRGPRRPRPSPTTTRRRAHRQSRLRMPSMKAIRGRPSAVVTLTLSAASASVVTVGYATAPGTATAGTDYTTTSGTATFAAGVTSTTSAIPIVGDTTVEVNETVLVDLTSPVNPDDCGRPGGR